MAEVTTLKSQGRTYTLYNEDCIDGMRERLAPGLVDAVVTSPPYNLGTAYKSYDDSIGREDYVQWLGRWGAAVHEVLKDDGSLFLNIGGKPSDPWGPFEVLLELRQHFTLQNVIHWVKSISIQKDDVGYYPGVSGNVSVGHYKPINSSRYINDCHEYIFHLTKTGNVSLDRLSIGVEYQDKSNIGRWGSADRPDRRCRGNTWFVPYKTIKSRDKQRPHPATFPVKIPKMCLQLHGVAEGGLVLDPFMGIGNTAIAATELRLNCVGFEIEADYCIQTAQAIQTAITDAA